MLSLVGVLAIVAGVAQIRFAGTARRVQVATVGGQAATMRTLDRGQVVQGAFAIAAGLFFILVWYSI